MLFLGLVQYGWSQMEMKLKPRSTIQFTDSIAVGRGGVSLWKDPSRLHYLTTPNVDSSRFSHGVAAGSVFTLQPDNIPCMKPATDVAYNLPVQTIRGNDNMPNGYQQPRNEL